MTIVGFDLVKRWKCSWELNGQECKGVKYIGNNEDSEARGCSRACIEESVAFFLSSNSVTAAPQVRPWSGDSIKAA